MKLLEIMSDLGAIARNIKTFNGSNYDRVLVHQICESIEQINKNLETLEYKPLIETNEGQLERYFAELLLNIAECYIAEKRPTINQRKIKTYNHLSQFANWIKNY